MKKLVVLAIGISLALATIAQAPQGFNYQAVIRNTEGQPIAGQTVGILITLQDQEGENVLYAETHTATTSPQGLVSLTVGSGIVVLGTFSEIPWSNGNIYIKVEVDPTGGTSYAELGTTKLNAVPYALHAQSATEIVNPNGGGDEPLFVVRNNADQIVFAVYEDGVRMYVNDAIEGGKTNKAGFAIGGLTGQKEGEKEYFRVTPDSVRINLRETAKTNKAGFAIGGLTGQKQETEDYMRVTRASTRISIDTEAAGKADKAGFAIGGLTGQKEGASEFLRVTRDSTRVYFDEASGGKTNKAGFAIGGLTGGKQDPDEYLRVTRASTRISIDTEAAGKADKAGFAIGGLTGQKEGETEYLRVTPDSTTIATASQPKRVTIKNPTDNNPLLSVDGSLKMGSDASTASGSISYDGEKFLTYEAGPGKDIIWKQFVVTGTPEVSTDSVYNITRNMATVAGRVLVDGGSEVSARGVCWSTTPSPTPSNNSQVSGSGVGPFVANLTGLVGSTTYYVRAYATNSQFTSFGQEIDFTTLPPELPSVTTAPISGITSTSATSGGNVTDDGAATITARGVCWNDTGNPDLSGNFTTNGTGTGEFSSSITGLQVNKTYFVRAYATNSVGTVYGEEYTFATTDLPVLSTSPITAVSGTSATSGGNIFAGGELAITQRGVCWNTTGNPTVDNPKTENGSGSGSFVSNMTGLTLGTTYFVRAYATNATGTAYGNEYFFTTLNVPTLSTNTVTNVTGNSAHCGGNISYNGGAVVTERGLCWNTTGSPTINDSKLELGDGSGEFTGDITELEIGTNYYVRAYATNSIGTGYGNERLFTTQNIATVVTAEVWDITYTTAKGGGNVTSDGGSAITQRGICWNTEGSPTLANSFTNNGEGTGEFASNLTGLAANNTYYVRAYAINSIGTTYGNEVSFSTPTIVPPPLGLPVVGTVKITTSNDGYHTGGYVMSDGGSPVTQRGVCWSTSQNPTTGDSFTTDGEGIGLYNSLIESLAGCGETYYVRAYATNSTGTGYGNQLVTTSGMLINIEPTTPITNITKISAESGGNIISDGGCEITERGICWGRKPNPTIANYKATAGSGIGSFSATLTGLYPNDIYYVRAYATNSVTTVYGTELSFQTEAGSSGIAIGQFYAGGYVFHLDETGDHGLVCATEVIGSAPWGCSNISIQTEAAVGTGSTNTATIIANCSEEGIAARLCNSSEHNGYDDWFLPSIDELLLMYTNLQLESIGLYWSSTEYKEGDDASRAYFIFLQGNTFYQNKSNTYNILAIRTF
jgi:hypothetical protein